MTTSAIGKKLAATSLKGVDGKQSSTIRKYRRARCNLPRLATAGHQRRHLVDAARSTSLAPSSLALL